MLSDLALTRFVTRRRILTIAVAAVLLLSGMLWLVWPLKFEEQFQRSKPELSAFAAKVTQNGHQALLNPPKRIGYFNVLKCEPLPDGFIFQSDYGNPFDWCGLAYSTTPLPEIDRDAKGGVKQTFTHLDTNWYSVFRP